MAALIAQVNSDTGRTRASRLAHHEVHTHTATWHTFVDTYLNRDGSGYSIVMQNGKEIRRIEWEAE